MNTTTPALQIQPKVTAATLGGSIATIAIIALQQFGVDVTAELAAAIATISAALLGWVARDAKPGYVDDRAQYEIVQPIMGGTMASGPGMDDPALDDPEHDDEEPEIPTTALKGRTAVAQGEHTALGDDA